MPRLPCHNDRSVALPLCLLVLALLPPPLAAQDLPEVTLATSERGEVIEELGLTGDLSAPSRARLSSDVEGRVERIAVEAGDGVERGAELLQLDRELARLDVEQARASLREIEAELADARRRLREARELAERQNIAESDVRAREAEVESRRAMLARQQAEVERRRVLLERHTLRAPFTGVVTRRHTDAGEWIEPGTVVYELAAVERLRLEVMAPQRYFGRVDESTPARVTVEALAGEPLATRVHEVIPDSDPDSRTFPVRIRLDNADLRMTPGMSARATLELATGREGVLVPRDALIRYPDGRVVVFVATGDGDERRVEERRVETGLGFDGRIEITHGLDAGMAVVVRGNEALRDGQRVQVDDTD